MDAPLNTPFANPLTRILALCYSLPTRIYFNIR